MPINNFIIATEPLDERLANEINPRRVAVGDSRFVINYFRMTPDRRLLFGGGENYRAGFPRDIASFVRPYMLKIYPQLAAAKIDYAWGGTLAITLNRMPHFGHLSKHVHFAHGYSGQGVGLAHLAGQLIAEMLHGDSTRFDAFARYRRGRFRAVAGCAGPAWSPACCISRCATESERASATAA